MIEINFLPTLRRRIVPTILIMLVSFSCCAFGFVSIFIMAPNQALQAGRISNLPLMDAGAVEAAEVGDTILVSGTLVDNPPLREDSDLVIYREDIWEVGDLVETEEGDSFRQGRWEDGETIVPDLGLEIDGTAVMLREASPVLISGELLREQIIEAEDGPVAEDRAEDRLLADGSQRLRGLANGDLATVLGKKASTGGIVPEEIFAGDRVAFETSQGEQASALLSAGICAMVLAPMFLIGGLAAVVFWRPRR